MTTTRVPQRKHYFKFIAYLQIIGIFLVVFGHSFHEYPDGSYGYSMLIYRMMHSFRMPLFMFVSGFLMAYTNRSALSECRPGCVRKFVGSKIKRLLLPFAVLTIVTFFPRTLMSGMADDAMELSLKSFFMAFLNKDNMVIPYLWFLQSSFTLLVICFGFIFLASRMRVSLIAVDVSLLLIAVIALYFDDATQFLSLGQTAGLAVFFVCGIIYAHFSDRIDGIVHWTSPVSFSVSLLLWILLFFLFEHTVWMPLCSAVGICACMSFAKILEQKKIGWLDPFLGANYLIFLLSWYFNIATQQILSKFVELPWQVHTFLSITCGFFVPWLMFRYMQRHRNSLPVRVAAYLLGQSLYKRGEKQA